MASKRKIGEKPRLHKFIQCNTVRSTMTEAISAAVTDKVMEQLRDSDITPSNGLNAASSRTDCHH